MCWFFSIKFSWVFSSLHIVGTLSINPLLLFSINKSLTSWLPSKSSFSTILQFALFTESIAVSSMSLSPLPSFSFEIIALIFSSVYFLLFLFESTLMYNQDKIVTKYRCYQVLSICFNLSLLPDVRTTMVLG